MYLGTEFGNIFDLSIVKQQSPLVIVFLSFYVVCVKQQEGKKVQTE